MDGSLAWETLARPSFFLLVWTRWKSEATSSPTPNALKALGAKSLHLTATAKALTEKPLCKAWHVAYIGASGPAARPLLPTSVALTESPQTKPWIPLPTPVIPFLLPGSF